MATPKKDTPETPSDDIQSAPETTLPDPAAPPVDATTPPADNPASDQQSADGGQSADTAQGETGADAPGAGADTSTPPSDPPVDPVSPPADPPVASDPPPAEPEPELEPEPAWPSVLFTVSDKIAAKSADELEAEIRGWGPEFLPADHDLRPYELAQFLAQLIYSQRLNRPTPTFDGDWLLILRQYHEDLNEWEMRQNA